MAPLLLHEAAKQNYAALVKCLLKAGARVDVRHGSGKTSIDVAKENDNWVIFNRLWG